MLPVKLCDSASHCNETKSDNGLTMLTTTVLTLVLCMPGDAGTELHSVFDAEWDRSMEQSPTWASSLGDRRFNTKWPDRSPQAIEAAHEDDKTVLELLHGIDFEELSPADQINFRLFEREYQLRVESFQYGWHLVPLTQRGGIQDAGSTADSLRFSKQRDFEDWLARMHAFPVYMDQTIELMREGIRRKIVPPRVIMKRIPPQIRKQIVSNPQQHLFFKPFRNMPDSVNAVQQKRLHAAATTSIEEDILPAYRKLLSFFEEEYLPACYQNVGVWQIPNGTDLYALRCREFTTTDLTPKEIHNIGLKEVARIRKEMESIIDEVKFKGDFKAFLAELRTNPKFYFDQPDDLLRAYLSVCKRIDPQLVKLFKKLPRVPYGVEPIPMHIAPDTTTAYYRPPAADGSRAGTYFVNLYRPQERPKYEMEALSLHEAVPGHHLQIALAQELDDLPRFRRFSGYTVFVEGWALYAESLGDELGLYQDPYSRFGQLTYEMWRAVRLVVDTGMHDMHWSREKAIQFFADNTAKTLLDIENEIDRYISWPGQALAYKIGELKIQELRRRCEAELGDAFDIRDFHDVVLRNGAVPLGVLETQIEEWLVELAANAKQSDVPEKETQSRR